MASRRKQDHALAFDYRTATRSEIAGLARTLVGRRLTDIDATAPMMPSSPQTKGAVGRIYEQAFGIPANSIPGPDFPGAAVELKSVPIRLVGDEARAKERISLGMINFASLPGELWESAHVRRKVDDLLLIFYRWDPLLPIARFETLAAEIWQPDAESLRQMKVDWERVRDLVADGRRDEVSEGLTRVLGAATKGPGHGSRSRAWSLKQSFVGFLYQSLVSRVSAEVVDEPDPAASFERSVLARMALYVGRPLDELAATVGRTGKGGKAASAQIVRALVGEHGTGRHGEFQRFGIETKVVPVDGRGRVIEAMSFPAFVHEELIFETWETSDLQSRILRLLIVPVHRERKAPLAEMGVGHPFFWSPTSDELDGIRREWEHFRHLIEIGHARHLPPASETKYIHVRPKARDARDRDPAPGGFDVIRKCFWLNQPYLERILDEHDALIAPPHR
jgi:DNA mismatch repair endonuclease MutH